MPSALCPHENDTGKLWPSVQKRGGCFEQKKEEERCKHISVTREKTEVRHGLGVVSVRNHCFLRGKRKF